MTQPVRKVPLQAKVSDEIADGIYINSVNILHNQGEFVLDFGRVVPGRPEFKILSRIIVSPLHVKQLLRALDQNIRQYESRFGAIAEPAGNGKAAASWDDPKTPVQ